VNSELSTKAEGAVISIEIADIYVTNDQTSVYWPVLFDMSWLRVARFKQ